MSQKNKPTITREQAKKAATFGLFVGIFGIHDFMIKRTALGIVHIVLLIYSVASMPVIFVLAFADAFRCGTGSMCPSGFNWGALFSWSILVPPLISFVMAIIESIILFATLSKYPSQYVSMQQQAPIDKNANL